MAKVEAPNREYNGPGPGGAQFEDGVADVNDEAALNYYRGAGYKVSGKVQSPLEDPETPDPREVTESIVGTRLRDAAVDPEPGDFLAPIGAGKGNPHGPEVVSPEIHASGPAGIRPGEVFVDDVDRQETREKEFAGARLVDGATAGEAVAVEVPDPDERGAIGLSDPGSVDAGAQAAKEVAKTEKAAERAADPDGAPAAKKTTAKKTTTRRAAAKKTAAKSS